MKVGCESAPAFSSSKAQANLVVISGNPQDDAALAIGNDRRIEIERVQRDDALTSVDIDRQTGCGEEKSPRFQPLPAGQDEDRRWRRFSFLRARGERDLDDLRVVGSPVRFGRRIEYPLQRLGLGPFEPVGFVIR